MRLSKERLRRMIEEVFEHYGAKCIPLEDFDTYLMTKHGLTKKEVRRLRFEGTKARIITVEIAVSDDCKPYNVVRLIEEGEGEYEVLG